MPICVHCEDEATIRKNTEIYKEQYGEDIPVKFHHLIRSEEACYLSSSKAIELAKKLERDCIFIIFLQQRKELFRNDIPLKEKNNSGSLFITFISPTKIMKPKVLLSNGILQ
jgi:dihydroorotase